MTQDQDAAVLLGILRSLAALDALSQRYESAAARPPARDSTAAGDRELRRKFEALTGDGYAERHHATGGQTAAERIAELDAAQEQAGVERVGYADTTSLVRWYDLEPAYRLPSGAAHGQEWTLVTTDHQGLQLTDKPGTTAGGWSPTWTRPRT